MNDSDAAPAEQSPPLNAEPRAEQNGGAADAPPVLIGVGASAGGLAALKSFFANVPENSGLAFGVVMHLSPNYESHLSEILQPFSKMPVRQVTDVVPIERDHVYLIPPGSYLEPIDGHLRLAQMADRRFEFGPIDHFFQALS